MIGIRLVGWIAFLPPPGTPGTLFWGWRISSGQRAALISPLSSCPRTSWLWDQCSLSRIRIFLSSPTSILQLLECKSVTVQILQSRGAERSSAVLSIPSLYSFMRVSAVLLWSRVYCTQTLLFLAEPSYPLTHSTLDTIINWYPYRSQGSKSVTWLLLAWRVSSLTAIASHPILLAYHRFGGISKCYF